MKIGDPAPDFELQSNTGEKVLVLMEK